MTAMDKITRAKAGLILSAPFYATLALRLEIIRDDKMQTMATDGKAIYYNETYVSELSDPVCKGMLAHEVIHNANHHHTRRGNRDPEQWNIACDLAINPGLIADGFQLWEGHLFESRFVGMSAEQIYSIRGKEGNPKPGQQGQGQPQPGQQGNPGQQGQGQPQPGQQGQGQPQPGQVLDAAPSHDKAALAEAEAEIDIAVMQANQVAKSAGNQSAEGQRLVAQIKKPKVDLRETLRRYVDSSVRIRETWNRPNRRRSHPQFFKPGTMKDGMANLGIIIDVSSSIDIPAFTEFMSITVATCEDVKPDQVDVVQCNTGIVKHDSFGVYDPIAVALKVGGGTDLQPAFDLCDDATVIICFTDCDFFEPIKDPGCPVLWVKYGNHKQLPQFGEIIQMEGN
jgi:predicted metal-dependent peptidase